jgi:hypothetical protein
MNPQPITITINTMETFVMTMMLCDRRRFLHAAYEPAQRTEEDETAGDCRDPVNAGSRHLER